MSSETEEPWCERRSGFAGLARYGYARSQHRYIWGVRLVLLTDERGLPLGYTVVAANEHEYERLADLLTGTAAEVVLADKAFWGLRPPRAARRRRPPSGCSPLRRPAPLPTPAATRARLNLARDRERLRQPQGPDAARAAPGEDPGRAGGPNRAADLALTIGILLNTLAGRPARALAAYDGR